MSTSPWNAVAWAERALHRPGEMYWAAGRGDIAATLLTPFAGCYAAFSSSSCQPRPLPTAPPILVTITPSRLAVAAAAAVVAGAVNSMAGGGTLLTFPALVAAGLSPLVANATSTVALVPGTLSSVLGYRQELAGARRWAVPLTVPSLVGGGLGALLLLRTPTATFDRVVPWLVLGATALFVLQRPIVLWTRRNESAPVEENSLVAHGPPIALLGGQLLIGVYGGYFGAGVGIFMLAALGFMGLSNIHRMNGLKSWLGFCMNAVAAASFAASGLVDWPVAISMSIGASVGGYIGSRAAQRVPANRVRLVVTVVGLASGLWLIARSG